MKKTFTILTMIALIFTLSTMVFGQKAARQRKQGKLGNFEIQNKTKGQRLAVLPFQNQTNNQSWPHGGAQAAQDVFVTEFRNSGKFNVVEREQLEAFLKKNNLTLSGEVDPSTAVKIGKSLGVNYLLTGAVTEYGNTDGGNARKRRLGMKVATKLIDTSTGEVVWATEARAQAPASQVSVGGFGGGVDDDRLFDKLMKDCAQQVEKKLATANLSENAKQRYANQEVSYRQAKGSEVAVESMEKSDETKASPKSVVFEPNNEPLWVKRSTNRKRK